MNDGSAHDGPSAVELLAALHDALLPKGLPVPQRVEIAARYLLAEDDNGAGGDWFDAIPLPDGRVVVVVGDVVGHGVGASVTMGELKTLFDERVRVDGDIVAALEMLDARARRVREARSTTVCVCVLDTRSGELTYCTAGHPPPVLVGVDRTASYLPGTGAGPLGSGRGFPVGRQQLREGDVLLLYSDGLVERPGRTPGQGMVELLQVAESIARSGAEDATPEQLVERVSRRTVEVLTRGTGYTDDITLLALQVVEPTPPLELRLRAEADSVRAARSGLRDWLAGLRVTDLDQVALLHAVGELVSNAVRHGHPDEDDGMVEVTALLTDDGLVDVAVSDHGRWREPGPGEGGRGLAIASGFLDELEVRHDEHGTRARGRHRLGHPAALLRGTRTAAAEPPTSRAGLGIDDDVLHLVGSLDVRSADELRHACARASRGGTRPITINLTEVDLLSSAAVQALYDARATGAVDILAPMGSPAQHVLDLVHLPYRS